MAQTARQRHAIDDLRMARIELATATTDEDRASAAYFIDLFTDYLVQSCGMRGHEILAATGGVSPSLQPVETAMQQAALI